MSKSVRFLLGRLLLALYLALTVECSDDSMSTYYVVFNTENTLYYDMSTEYIATTATSSHFSSVVVAPSATPNVREMEDNAVVMSFNEISLDRWMQIESIFLAAIADECTKQCAKNGVDCGIRNNVNYTSDDVIILPGYPKIEDGKLLVAFSVSLPSDAVLADDRSVISQNTLLTIAAAAVNAITDQTGVQVDTVGRYTASAEKTSKSENNVALIICLTLIIPSAILSMAAGFGTVYAWKMAKKYKNLNLLKQPPKSEQVELMSYRATLVNN